MQDPKTGYNSYTEQYQGQYHSEQRLLSELYGTIIPQLKTNGDLKTGDTLHYDLFTQYYPCGQQCSPSTFAIWQQTLAKQAGTNVDLKVWTLNTGVNKSSVLYSPGQIQQYWP